MNGIATLEDSITVSHQIKQILTTQPSFHTLAFSKRSWNLCPQGNLHTDDLAASLIIARSWKQPKMFFSWWMDKLCYIQTMKCYSAIKGNELSNHERPGGSLNAYFYVKEPKPRRLDSVWFQLYDILEKTKLWRQ